MVLSRPVRGGVVQVALQHPFDPALRAARAVRRCGRTRRGAPRAARPRALALAQGEEQVALLHRPHEPLEQVERVVRAGRRLRVVLHGEGPRAGGAEALDGAVVQVHVGDAAVSRQVAIVHREAVVLAGDLDLAGRLVSAPAGCRRGGRT